MKLFVVGATGATGIILVNLALDNHQVTAYVRSPEQITEMHENLNAKQGDIFDIECVTKRMAGHDAVISCLGFPKYPESLTGYLESHKILVDAMRKNNITRLITMSSWYSDISCDDANTFYVRWVILPFWRTRLEGMLKMELFLRSSCPDINYTVVRSPLLGGGEITGKKIQVTEEAYSVNTGTSFNKTSRADVARFLLFCLKIKDYNGKMIAITTTPKIQSS